MWIQNINVIPISTRHVHAGCFDVRVCVCVRVCEGKCVCEVYLTKNVFQSRKTLSKYETRNFKKVTVFISMCCNRNLIHHTITSWLLVTCNILINAESITYLAWFT